MQKKNQAQNQNQNQNQNQEPDPETCDLCKTETGYSPWIYALNIRSNFNDMDSWIVATGIEKICDTCAVTINKLVIELKKKGRKK